MIGIVYTPFRLPTFDDTWKRECRTCGNLHAWVSTSGGAHLVMQCKREPVLGGNFQSCIDCRAEDGACGPESRLWRRV